VTIRRKTAYNLDAQQVSLVLQAIKGQRKRCDEGRENAMTGGDEKATQNYAEMVAKYDSLIQYFEDKI
jgi:hypothetical protein